MSAGAIATELREREGKPAYVTFRAEAKHLPKLSEKEGRYITKDVDYVTVRQIGAADSNIFEVESWLKQIKADAQGGRLPHAHVAFYEESYKRWKAGQEMPVHGTPIKGWQIITPAQSDILVHVGVRTVEDLAALNDEGLKRVGMGAVDLKNKAVAWLAAATDKGKLAQEMAAAQKENALLKSTVEKLTSDMEELKRLIKVQTKVQSEPEIAVTDLIEDEPAPRGKKR